MKPNYILVTLLVSVLLISSCQKEDLDIDLTTNNWKVEKIRRSGQLTYESTDSSYILRFLSDTAYTLSLDVNTCFGQYEILHKGSIEIQAMGCTEVCCDSDLAVDLSLLFPKMTQYFGKEDELHFEGDGKIVLKSY